ncbi:AfsR/SARP family transcriptional regulator [Micromonospora wenchangensis]|uniref:AfsR/SARP family transcriptional regulator n=1 Tax=Micromonospora wenchangensis TaxID=1185415 RepID=UPI003D740EC2
MLAVNANRSVSIDRLVDAIWDDRPPATAREQVQNCVSVVRRAVGGGAGGVRISLNGRGYQLEVDPSEIDAYCFEQKLHAAVEKLAAGHPESAVATYRDALAIWTGPALDGMDGAELRAYAHRLDELRAAATERLIATQMELGRFDEAVADLRCLTRLHPTDERFLVLLIDALLSSHRQPEALAAYSAFAKGLADEFGSYPGPSAREAERRIHEALDHDIPPTAKGAFRQADIARPSSLVLQPDGVQQESELVRHLEEAMSHIHTAYSLLDADRKSRPLKRHSGRGRVA